MTMRESINDYEIMGRTLLAVPLVTVLFLQARVANELGLIPANGEVVVLYAITALVAWAMQSVWMGYLQHLDERYQEWRGIDG